MPIYNEESTFLSVIKQLLRQDLIYEIVIINDGSSDSSKAILDAVQCRQVGRIKIFHKSNGGKGSAIRYGLGHVTGDYVLIQDGDLEYSPEDIPRLIEPVLQKQALVIYGSRFLGKHENWLFWHFWGNRLLNTILNSLYGSNLTDMETGYKLIPTRLLRDLKLEASDFRIEPEITCKLLLKSVAIYEVPIQYSARNFDKGKKITWIDGLMAIPEMVKWRLR